MQVGVGEFKNRLSELLKRAAAGEEIVVACLGRPVERLGPVAALATAGSGGISAASAQPALAATQRRPTNPCRRTARTPGLEGEPLLSDLMLADRE